MTPEIAPEEPDESAGREPSCEQGQQHEWEHLQVGGRVLRDVLER